MCRTRRRPLPTGRLGPAEARRFGWALALAGLAALASVNLLSAAIGAATLTSYLFVYTPLKRITPHCTLVGAFATTTPARASDCGRWCSPREAWWRVRSPDSRCCCFPRA
jgi:protoheme IX farnesyltransferase